MLVPDALSPVAQKVPASTASCLTISKAAG